MDASSPCPDASRLRALLGGGLSAAEQAELTAHLDACPRCRQRLEQSAGGTQWLPGSRNWDPGDEAPLGEHLQRVMSHLLSCDGRSGISKPGGARGGELSFLTPAVHPGLAGHFGPYDVIEVLGEGGMGIVLKAHDLVLNRTVAVKVLSPHMASDPSARTRFLREARSAAAVNHDHLVTIYAVDEVNRLPYLAMEYIDGPSLQERIDSGEPPSVQEIVRIGMQIASGLAAAHARGLVHRDIKPANILLDSSTGRAKITDFGLAKADTDVAITQTGVLAGTPRYMAPEQARGGHVDHRADLFSLGSVLYTMCTGQVPFQAPSTMAVLHQLCEQPPPPIREVNPDIPQWLVEIIDRLLAKRPEDRFQSAAEVAQLLGQHLTHLESAAGRTASALAGGPVRSRRWKRMWLAVVGAVAVLVAAAGLTELAGLTNFRRFLRGWSAEAPAKPEPKPAAQTPPATRDAFLLYGQGGSHKAFASLADAIAAAAAGDTVEIRQDGLIAGQTVRVDKPLTIRAGEGHQPVFEMASPRAPCFEAQAALVLEGISFRHVSSLPELPPRRLVRPRRAELGVVVARDAPLHLANCRFLVVGPDQPPVVACVAATAPPICEICNCLFLGTGGTGVNWVCIDGNRLLVSNSAFVGLTCINADLRASAGSARPEPVEGRARRPAVLNLTRSTLCGREALLLLGPRDPAGIALEVQASESLFEVGSVLRHPDGVADGLPKFARWQDERNVFAALNGFVSVGHPAGHLPEPAMITVKDLTAWNALWKQTDTGSRAVPSALGPKLARKVRAVIQEITAEDFRVKDIRAGADVDLLGPGKPYDRWRKTPEYQLWMLRLRRARSMPK